MGLKRAGTVSAGALAFMAVAVGPSSAQARERPDGCELGGLLCGVLRSLPGRPTPSPGRSTRPKPRPRPAADRENHDAPPHRMLRVPPPTGHAPPLRRTAAELPDISHQTPVVTPWRADAPPTPVAVPADETIPPFPVAAASCIIGTLATLHLSVLARRLRRRP